MQHRFSELFGDSFFEFLFKAVVALFATVIPYYGMLGAMIFLVMVDFATGLLAARRSGESITARKMRNTPSKMFFYILMVLTALVFEKNIWDAIPMIKIFSVFISLTELKSIMENFNKGFGIDLLSEVKQHLKNLKP